jgi:hypothetical protein
MEKYVCPVCGYPDLDFPPYDTFGIPSFNICLCCGCEFGYQDATLKAKRAFLNSWKKRGFPWRYPDKKPENWDVKSQLKTIGIDFDKIEQ